MNAVIGVTNDCIAAHGSDMAVAMAALDARVETVAADGTEVDHPALTRFIVRRATRPISRRCWRRAN